MVTLPTPVPAASGWSVVDWLSQLWTSRPAGVDGLLTIDTGQLDPEVMWLVDHVVVQTTATKPTVLKVYDSAVEDSRLVDGTSVGNLNVNDYPSGLVVRPGRSLVYRFTGANAGAVATVGLQARIMRRAG